MSKHKIIEGLQVRTRAFIDPILDTLQPIEHAMALQAPSCDLGDARESVSSPTIAAPSYVECTIGGDARCEHEINFWIDKARVL